MQVLLPIIFVEFKFCENLRIEDNFNNTFQKYVVSKQWLPIISKRYKVNEKCYLWGCVYRIKSGNVLYNIYLQVSRSVRFPIP